ncbi:6-phosphofructokinase [Candidatus Kaiserbacteria bacterium]|nr:6-phosphofructokinase [Candidatus Kaiserbacteria bacterium]
MKWKVLIAQGGGPTAVINWTLVSILLTVLRMVKGAIVYGARHGVRGILKEDFLDLTNMSARELKLIANTPSAALGSTRDKPNRAYCRKILRILQAHGINVFFYIGGEDTARTLRMVSREAKRIGYSLRCIHVLKTVDCDLVGSDHTIGFPSAATFVVQALMGADLDNASLPGVYLAVVMGRKTGWLTAAAPAHLKYLPERPFSLRKFLSDVRACYALHGRCVIAVSEGVRYASGALVVNRIGKRLKKDPHGHVQLSGTGTLADFLCDQIKKKLGISRVRGDTLGYLQRSFPGCISDVDRREASDAGKRAVEFALSSKRDGSVTLRRTGDYKVDYSFATLTRVAGKTRRMPNAFIHRNGRDTTPAFDRWLRPLLGHSMPKVHRLHAPSVQKILNK